MTKTEMLMERSARRKRTIIRCSNCEHYDFNYMSDEGYCAKMDYEPVRIYRKLRPDWCPRLKRDR